MNNFLSLGADTTEKKNALTPVTPESLGEVSVVTELTLEGAFANLSSDELEELQNFADTIDARNLEVIMNYGGSIFDETFVQAGEYLQTQQDNSADRRVYEMVQSCIKDAEAANEAFTLCVKEPSAVMKLVHKVIGMSKDERYKQKKAAALTNYKLFKILSDACEKWMEELKQAFVQINTALESDASSLVLLEKYIIAGMMAKQRMDAELLQLETKAQSGMQRDMASYSAYSEGLRIFEITLNRLQEMRYSYYLSCSQLILAKKANLNVQMEVTTQKKASMAMMGMQLRNAVLNAHNQEVIEGQQGITALNSKMMEEISKQVGLTHDESVKLLYKGIYTMEAATEAFKFVSDSYAKIGKACTVYAEEMRQNVDKINQYSENLSHAILGGNNIPDSTGTVTTVKNTPKNGLGLHL